MDDLLGEIRDQAAKNQRVLVTTSQRMAEDLTDYLAENEVRVRYLHSRSTDRADRDHPGPAAWGIRRARGVNLLRRVWTCRGASWRSSMPTRKASCGPSALIQTIGQGPPCGRGGAALCRQHDRLNGQGHQRNRATPGDPADLQREARRFTAAAEKASNSILSFLS